MQNLLKRFTQWSFMGLCLMGLWLALSGSAIANPLPTELGKAVTEVENLDALRTSLASTLEGREEPITGETFKQVCKPVGMQAMKLSQDTGWQVKQIATKYRNPSHAPDTDQARNALARFERDRNLQGFWEKATINGEPGVRYYRRIDVQATCLGCHGAKADRPEFVQANYPDDRAYDFSVGDLRGMYAVFIPDSTKAALASAIQ